MSLISRLRKYLRVDGDGYFTGNITAANFSGSGSSSGTNTGDVTIGTANGLSLVGQALSLATAVAGGANGALLGTDKTKLNATSGTNSGDFTLASFGSTPATEGASRSGQVLTLQPADATHGGGVSITTQTFAGDKTHTGLLAAIFATGMQLRFGTSTSNNGGYLFSGNPNEALVAAGATFASGTWTSRSTGVVAIYGAETGGTFGVWINSGTTSGSSFSPTNRLSVSTTGAVVTGTLSATSTVTGSNLSGTNTGDVTIGTANGLSLSGQALSLAAAVAAGANGALLGTDKTKLDATSGTNSGDVTIGTANGLSLSGQALSLAAAVAAGASGALTGADKTKLDATSGTNTGDLTLATVGSTPAAAGASLSGQVLTLQPANASNGGVVSTTTQTFAGAKTVSSVFTSSVAANSDAFAMGAGAQINFGGRNLKDDGSNLILSSGAFVGNGIQKNSSSVPVGVGSQVTDAVNRHAVQVYCSNTLSSAGTNLVSFENPQNTQVLYIGPNGEFGHKYTDSTGTPGAATINKPAGKSAIAALATTVVVTNSVVAAADIIQLTPLDIDATATNWKAVPAAGSFTVTVNAAATATWKFSWYVIKAF